MSGFHFCLLPVLLRLVRRQGPATTIKEATTTIQLWTITEVTWYRALHTTLHLLLQASVLLYYYVSC